MKAWRIHFAWTIVTVLATAISARIASRQAAVDGDGRGRSPAGLERNPRAAAPEPREKTIAPTVKGELASKSATPPADSSLADRIRGMLKDPNTWEKLQELVELNPDRQFILSLLKEALFGKDLQSCYGAIHFLIQMKGRDGAEVLESYLKTHGNEDQAPNVASALGEIRDPGSIPVLMDALQSKNPQVRLWSAEALHEMGFSRPAEDLITEMARQYESPDGGLRKKAIDTLSQFDLASVVPILTLALRDSNSDVRSAALTGFLNLKKPEYIPLLQPLLGDPIPEVAAQAEQFIEALKNP